MSYDITLKRIDLFEEDDYLMEDLVRDEQVAQAKLVCFAEDAAMLLDRCLMFDRYPHLGKEDGFFSSIADFVATIFRTAVRVVSDTADWLSKKIKSIVNLRKKKKEFRDKNFAKFMSLYNSLDNYKRTQAQAKFAAITMEHLPPFKTYQRMCRGFAELIVALDRQVGMYTSKDIQEFGVEGANKKTTPTWLIKLYDDPQAREALQQFGLRYEEANFVYHSAFNNFPEAKMSDLGYENLDYVRVVNQDYLQFCWARLHSVVNLRERFENFERELKDKEREMKKHIASADKKAMVGSCKNVMSSAVLASKLTSYLTQIEEALDTRRGWVINTAIRACVESLGGDQALTTTV